MTPAEEVEALGRVLGIITAKRVMQLVRSIDATQAQAIVKATREVWAVLDAFPEGEERDLFTVLDEWLQAEAVG